MKRIVFVIPLLVTAALAAFFLFKPKSAVRTQIPIALNTPTPQAIDITGTFEIYTLGTKRIFTDAKYHNQSENVFITAANPSVIYIKKEGITWSDFFNTLPMKLTKECLTTGTGQVFCTNESQKLKFFINNVENDNSLDEMINNGDQLKVIYE